MAISNLAYIDETGYHFSDYPGVLSYLENAYREIYGQDVYIDADSQDGQLLAIFASAIYDALALGASTYNSFSPSTAQGVGLSRNVKINGIARKTSTYSTVDLYLVGQVGAVITNGQAEDILNQKWNLPASVTIPSGGSITVTATAANVGAVSAAANTITTIATPTLGWQTVNNPAQVTEGAPIELDAQLRIRQSKSVAIPSLSVFDGIIGAVASLDGVTRYRGYENDTNSTDANNIPAHSISLVVEGGVTQEIGDTIAIKKTPGTGTFGTTTVTTYDEYGMPNAINFYRPTAATISVEVDITALLGYTSGYETLIAQAIAETINVLDIGDDVLLTKLYVPANLPGTAAGATFDITQIQIKKNAGSFAASNITIAFNEVAECDPSDVTVNVS